MNGFQRQSGGSSGGSGRNGVGGGSGSSGGNSHTNSTLGGGASPSAPQTRGYDPNPGQRYMETDRSPWFDHTHLNLTTNPPGFNAAPIHQSPPTQQPRAYNGSHHFDTRYASPHLNVPYEPSDGNLDISGTYNVPSPAERHAQQQQQQQYQPPIGNADPNRVRSGPYDGICYIRRDGSL